MTDSPSSSDPFEFANGERLDEIRISSPSPEKYLSESQDSAINTEQLTIPLSNRPYDPWKYSWQKRFLTRFFPYSPIVHDGLLVDDPHEIFSWSLMDIGYSVFATSYLSIFVGPWITQQANNVADPSGNVHLFGSYNPDSPSNPQDGIPVSANSLFSFSITASIVLQIFCLPLFCAIAEGGVETLKKHLLIWVTIGSACVFATGLIFSDILYWLSTLLFIFSNLSYGASTVFYYAYLAHISSESQRDSVSSVGFAWGYIGALILLSLQMINFAIFEPETAVRFIFFTTGGIWVATNYWGAIAIRPFSHPRVEDTSIECLKSSSSFSSSSSSGSTHSPRSVGRPTARQIFHKLVHAAKLLKNHLPHSLRFLIAAALYLDGVHTVSALAGIYGVQELHFDITFITIVLISVQLAAALGAWLFLKVSQRFNPKKSIEIQLIIWSFCIIYVAFILKTKVEFALVGIVIGLVLGGVQALSRSIYSRLIPKQNAQIYWGLYEISDRGSSFLGPLVFGLVQQFTHGMSFGLFALIFFFIFGLIILHSVDTIIAKRDLYDFEHPDIPHSTDSELDDSMVMPLHSMGEIASS